MFFNIRIIEKNINTKINQTIVDINENNKPRYNLDMLTNKINKNFKKLDKETKEKIEKKNKIKTLKIVGPKNHKKWSEDIFEEIKNEEHKEKIKKLKLIEPKIDRTTTNHNNINNDNQNDTIYINDWDEVLNS